MRPLAPICLFVYNRPQHTVRTLDALAGNPLAGASDLLVFADGPRHRSDLPRVAAVRAVIGAERRFRRVRIQAREENQGLARSVIQGLDWTLDRYESAIVLEDDLVTAPEFLDYMNDALARFGDEPRVGAVQGYQFPSVPPPPGMFFSRVFGSWGWATWRRSWNLFEADGRRLLRALKTTGRVREFNLDGQYNYYRMLREQGLGQIDSWFIRWYASQFLHGNLALWPGRSLVENIGMDGTGAHCPATGAYATRPGAPVLAWDALRIEPDPDGTRSIEAFFRAKGGGAVQRWCRYHCPVWLKRLVESR